MRARRAVAKPATGDEDESAGSGGTDAGGVPVVVLVG
jgi:hypothetical protein